MLPTLVHDSCLELTALRIVGGGCFGFFDEGEGGTNVSPSCYKNCEELNVVCRRLQSQMNCCIFSLQRKLYRRLHSSCAQRGTAQWNFLYTFMSGEKYLGGWLGRPTGLNSMCSGSSRVINASVWGTSLLLCSMTCWGRIPSSFALVQSKFTWAVHYSKKNCGTNVICATNIVHSAYMFHPCPHPVNVLSI